MEIVIIIIRSGLFYGSSMAIDCNKDLVGTRSVCELKYATIT